MQIFASMRAFSFLMGPLLIYLIASDPQASSQRQSATISVTSQGRNVTIAEPAPVKIEELLKQADLAAVVRLLSGDTENYPRAVYKAEVLEPFKGIEKGSILYFGPFIGLDLGGEYLLFLRHLEEGVKPKEKASSAGLNYGPIPDLYEVMYEGYSAISIGYDCVFDGKEISEQCDYGMKLNTKQVILPKSIRTYPSLAKGSFAEDTKWVRKAVFTAYLRRISN